MDSSLDKDDRPANAGMNPVDAEGVRGRKVVSLLLQGMSIMSVREQQAVVIILLLALLGVGVRLWHLI